jgi:hypothetical protein
LNVCAPHIDPQFVEIVTDINGFWLKCERLLDEPTFKNHQKIMFAYTDGYHDVGKNNRRLRCPNIIDKNVAFYTACWKNKSLCQGTTSISFESLDGFLSYLKTTN